jgi:AraC-like DNA-binding protein
LYNPANLEINAAKTSGKPDMELINDQQAKREADRAQAHRDELTERIAQAIRHDGTIEPLKGLHFYRSSSPSECVHGVSIPAFCAIAQGSKEVLLGNVSPLDANLLDAVVRLVRLLDCPAEANVLAPLIEREIIYRLLMGEQGGRLRHIAVLGGSTHQIARAVDRLRKDFNQPLRIESIARELGMSVSSFHHHFKSVTAMSPLQFQKQLRLQEARRLMLGQNLDATSAAYRVGYDDSSHFNREYKRLFGIPPMRDMERLREAAREIASST